MQHKMIQTLSIFLMLGILFACSGSKGPSTQDETALQLEEIKPKPEDEYRTLMGKTMDNFNYMTLGFLTYDEQKVKGSAVNMAALSDDLNKKMPSAYESAEKKWEGYCKQLLEQSKAIEEKYLKKEYDAAEESFTELRATCMGCHLLYRKAVVEEEYY